MICLRIFFGFFWILTLNLLIIFQVQAENGDLMIHLEDHGAKTLVLKKKGGRVSVPLSEDEMDQLLTEFGNYVEDQGYDNLSPHEIENFFIVRGYTFALVDSEDPEYVDPREYEMALSTLKQTRLIYTGIIIIGGVMFSLSFFPTVAVMIVIGGFQLLGGTYHNERFVETYFFEKYEKKVSSYFLSKTIEIRRILEQWQGELSLEGRSLHSIFNVAP